MGWGLKAAWALVLLIGCSLIASWAFRMEVGGEALLASDDCRDDGCPLSLSSLVTTDFSLCGSCDISVEPSSEEEATLLDGEALHLVAPVFRSLKYPERVSDSLSKERDTLPRSPSKRFFVTCGTTAQGHTLAVSKEGPLM